MRLDISKVCIDIIPENVQDIIYIEKHLNLKEDGDCTKCVRKNAAGLSCIASLEIRPKTQN